MQPPVQPTQVRRQPEPRAEFRTPAPEPELRPAPPSARKQPEPVETESERRERRAARTPNERLREVFSTDIPENIMELTPSAPPSEGPRYGRAERHPSIEREAIASLERTLAD